MLTRRCQSKELHCSENTEVQKKDVFPPNSKNTVNQESTEEAKNHIGPRVPGVQLHEAGSVQAQILVG